MKNTAATLMAQKQSGEKITMLTAYDYTTARIEDECGVNSILVGDSLGMVMLGYENTLPVTMEDMIHHTAAVSRGAIILAILFICKCGTIHITAIINRQKTPKKRLYSLYSDLVRKYARKNAIDASPNVTL